MASRSSDALNFKQRLHFICRSHPVRCSPAAGTQSIRGMRGGVTVSEPKSTQPEVRPCPACGIGLQPASEACSCGAQIPSARNDPGRVGMSIPRTGWLRHEKIVVSDDSGSCVVLSPNGKTDILSRVPHLVEPVPGISLIGSALYRLETIARHSNRWRRPLDGWLEEYRSRILADELERRRYAMASVAAGDWAALDELSLGDFEKTWLRMHACRLAGDWRGAVERACLLPADRYLDQYDVVLAAVVNEIELDETVRQRLSAKPDHPGAVLASFLAGDSNESEPALEAITAVAGEPFEPARFGVLHAVEVMMQDPPTGYVTASALSQLSGHAAAVDDFIDRYPQRVRLNDRSPDALVARVDPSRLDDAALKSLHHEAEIARRAYVQGNLDKLGDTPSARHFAALAAMRDGHPFDSDQLMDPRAVEVARAVHTGDVPDRLLDDPTVWPVLADHLTEENAAAHPKHAAGWYLKRSLNALWAWNFELAAKYARQVLKHSESETERDEALNIVAYTLYLEGRDQDAIAALDRALAGEYSASLQSNIGVIAESLEPNKAAAHLAAMASEAPTLELKLAAARRAFTIWDPDHPVWEDDDADATIPTALRDVLRELAVAATQPDEHRWVMQLLSYVDKDWLSNPRNVSASPNVATTAHKYYLARARGSPEDYIAAMVAGLNAEPDAAWLQHERDQMVESLRAMIFSGDDNPGPAMFAFEAVTQGLPMSSLDRVVLAAGAVLIICQRLGDEGSEPSDRIRELLKDARRGTQSIEEDMREKVLDLLDIADTRYAGAIYLARQQGVSEAVNALQQIDSRLRYIPRRQVNMQVVWEMLNPIKGFLRETVKALEDALPHARDPLILAETRVFLQHVKDLLRDVENYR